MSVTSIYDDACRCDPNYEFSQYFGGEEDVSIQDRIEAEGGTDLGKGKIDEEGFGVVVLFCYTLPSYATPR
jgi:hypothetical protein